MTHAKLLDLANSDVVLDDEKREVFEQIVAKYESDWYRDATIRWQDYLPEDVQLRACLIAELPMIDAEFQRRTNNSQKSSTATAAESDSHESLNTLDPQNGPAKNVRSFRSIANYQNVIREIRGGLGDVFVIRDLELNRLVVVKRLQSRWVGDVRAERAFHREVKITSLLEHPSIVPVHSVGTTADGRPFYSMRFVDGLTLQQAIDEFHKSNSHDPTLLRNLLTHFIQICRTIAYANSCGIIHRDLKPSNIVIGQFGQTLVLDWGLAKELQNRDAISDIGVGSLVEKNQTFASVSSFPRNTLCDEADFFLDTNSQTSDTCRSETTLGDVIGTPAYMSPEQALGQVTEFSARTDVFGLGAVLYAILYGRPPFVGRDSSETISLAAEGAPDFSIHKSKDSIFRGLVAICRKANLRDSRQRYSDAQSLADDLENWLAGESIDIQKQPLTYRLGKVLMRQRTLAVAASLLLLATIAAVIGGIQAVQAQKLQTLIAENDSKSNARVAKNVAEYIAKVYRTADPIRFDDPGFAGNGDINAKSTLNAILDGGYDLINTELYQHPEPYSELLLSLGASYRGIGKYDQSSKLLSQAAKVRKQLYGDRDCRALECDYQLARLNYEQGDYANAETQLRRLIEQINQLNSETHKQSPTDKNKDIDLLLANTKFQLGWMLFYQPLGLAMPQFKAESVAESQQLFREVIDIRKRYLPRNDRSIGLGYAGLAAVLFCTMEKEAMITAVTAMEILNNSDQENSFGSFLIEYNKAESLRRAGKFEDAQQQYLKLSTFVANQVGENHPVMAIHRWNMVGFYRKFGKMDQAETMISTIRDTVKNLPAIRSSLVHTDSLRQYAESLVEHQRIEDAIEVYSEIISCAQERPTLNAELISNAQAQLDTLRQTLSSTIDRTPR